MKYLEFDPPIQLESGDSLQISMSFNEDGVTIERASVSKVTHWYPNNPATDVDGPEDQQAANAEIHGVKLVDDRLTDVATQVAVAAPELLEVCQMFTHQYENITSEIAKQFFRPVYKKAKARLEQIG